MTKDAQRGSAVTVVSALIIFLALGYMLVYSPYIPQKEETAKLATAEAKRVADEAARKVAEEAVTYF